MEVEEKESHMSEFIQSTVYRLVESKKIEEIMIEHEVRSHEVVIEPILGSVCHADLRYFTGQRRQKDLKEKLPMALIHEGIGRVVCSPSGRYKEGEQVVIVPNVPGYLEQNKSRNDCCSICQKDGGENYCQEGYFLGSGCDGVAQSRLVLPEECAIPIPEEVPNEIALLSELCTVSYQAIHKISSQLSGAKLAIFGDGPVGYLTAAMLHFMFGLPKEQLTVFGADEEKLQKFNFTKCENVNEYDFSEKLGKIDIAFDCTGGDFSEKAINQAINIIKPLGTIVLLGVTEKQVPLNTRDVLEKGITLVGSSRSSYVDYSPVIEKMKQVPFQRAIMKLLPEESWIIDSPEQFCQVMEYAAENHQWQKVVLQFHW